MIWWIENIGWNYMIQWSISHGSIFCVLIVVALGPMLLLLLLLLFLLYWKKTQRCLLLPSSQNASYCNLYKHGHHLPVVVGIATAVIHDGQPLHWFIRKTNHSINTIIISITSYPGKGVDRQRLRRKPNKVPYQTTPHEDDRARRTKWKETWHQRDANVVFADFAGRVIVNGSQVGVSCEKVGIEYGQERKKRICQRQSFNKSIEKSMFKQNNQILRRERWFHHTRSSKGILI